MSGNRRSTAKSTPALDERADIAAVSFGPASIIQWNLCQGIPPIVIESPRLFFVAQAIVMVLGVAIVVVLLLIF